MTHYLCLCTYHIQQTTRFAQSKIKFMTLENINLYSGIYYLVKILQLCVVLGFSIIFYDGKAV